MRLFFLIIYTLCITAALHEFIITYNTNNICQFIKIKKYKLTIQSRRIAWIL